VTALNSAHGGPGWQPRAGSLRDEIGAHWAACGVSSEVGALRHVLLCHPCPAIEAMTDPAAALWDAYPDLTLLHEQHAALAAAYERFGVRISYISHDGPGTPNLHFCRDHFFTTPQGAVVSRMGSAARAGEERYSAEALARVGVPILLTVHGEGTFEAADIFYLADGVVLVARGMRSNDEGCRQVAHLLTEVGLQPLIVEMPHGTGHLDGGLTIVDRRKAIARPYHCPLRAYETLIRLGYEVLEAPDEGETARGAALNMVPLAPGVVLMPGGNPRTRRALEAWGVECHEVGVGELFKGGGSVHCMTGVIARDPA
jgi:N-dimethylarginine dimethylaminohydrolase